MTGCECVQAAPFTGRIFITHAGWRQTEPASLTAVATHHCFTHLLTHLAGHMLDAQKTGNRSTGDNVPRPACRLVCLQYCWGVGGSKFYMGHVL